MVFFNALGGIIGLLLIVALGYLLYRLGWFPAPCRQLIPRLVTNVALPPFLATTIIARLSRDELGDLLKGAIPPALTMILLFLGAWLFAKLVRVPKTRVGVFCACVSNPNTIFIGIPVNLALFGPDSIPYVLIYYFASTTFFWTVGNYFISRDSPEAKAGIRWENILSPPILGFIVGVVSILCDIPWPRFIFKAAVMIGELTTPLALLFVGVTLAAAGKIRIGRDLLFAATGRLIISPLLFLSVAPFFDLPRFARDVFAIQSSLPVVLQVSILSAYYKADAEFGSEMVAFTTICCAFTTPLAMCLL
ncbi:MAG: AEC family transporter [Desulfovibrio sp.]|nr:AEC family transporter [Desulfovibrio sp.]